MSRLGKTPIKLPKGVQVSVKGSDVEVKGPKGTLFNTVPEGIEVVVSETEVIVGLKDESMGSAVHGLHRNLIKNSIVGVSEGYEKTLTLIGVGFRAAVAGNKLDLQIGFSHPSQVEIPEGISVKVDKATTVIISGIDKQRVGQFAATIRDLRPPEPYKGKGIRYEKEYVRKKEGKAAKGK